MNRNGHYDPSEITRYIRKELGVVKLVSRLTSDEKLTQVSERCYK